MHILNKLANETVFKFVFLEIILFLLDALLIIYVTG